jgi:hypothetical protein
MPKIDIVLNVEQIVENIRQLSEEDQRNLAASVLRDRALEPFVEELEDNLICERRQNEPVVPS